MSGNNSINGNKHPYLRVEKWEYGQCAFWRDKPGMYSKASIEKFEEWLVEWRGRTRIKQDEIKRARV